MITSPTLFSVLVFFAIFLFFVGILQYCTMYSRKRELVDKIRGDGEDGELVEKETASSKRALMMILEPLLYLLSKLGKRLGSEKSQDYPQLRMKFLKAGFRRQSVPHIYWGVKCFLMISFPLGFFLGVNKRSCQSVSIGAL